MSLDWSKPLRRRDGARVRVVCMDAQTIDNRSVCVLYDQGGSECAALYTLEGKIPGFASNHDLINAPEERWVNLYEGGALVLGEVEGPCYPSRQAALANADTEHGFIGTFKLVEE